MIGGGSPRILRIAGREADIVSLNFNNRMRRHRPRRRAIVVGGGNEEEDRLDRDGAGARFDDIEIEIGAYFTFVIDDAKPMVGDVREERSAFRKREMLKHPHALFGGVETICEELQRRRDDYGISYVTVPEDAMVAFAPVVARLSGSSERRMSTLTGTGVMFGRSVPGIEARRSIGTFERIVAPAYRVRRIGVERIVGSAAFASSIVDVMPMWNAA